MDTRCNHSHMSHSVYSQRGGNQPQDVISYMLRDWLNNQNDIDKGLKSKLTRIAKRKDRYTKNRIDNTHMDPIINDINCEHRVKLPGLRANNASAKNNSVEFDTLQPVSKFQTASQVSKAKQLHKFASLDTDQLHNNNSLLSQQDIN